MSVYHLFVIVKRKQKDIRHTVRIILLIVYSGTAGAQDGFYLRAGGRPRRLKTGAPVKNYFLGTCRTGGRRHRGIKYYNDNSDNSEKRISWNKQ